MRLLLHSVPNYTHFVFFFKIQSAYIFNKYFYIFELNISKLLLKYVCRDLVVYKLIIKKMKKKTYKIPQNLKWSFTTLAGYVLVIVNYKFEGSPLRRGNEIGMYFNVVCTQHS